MVLILDGSSNHGAHIWSKLGISVCWRHSERNCLNPFYHIVSGNSLLNSLNASLTCEKSQGYNSLLRVVFFPSHGHSILKKYIFFAWITVLWIWRLRNCCAAALSSSSSSSPPTGLSRSGEIDGVVRPKRRLHIYVLEIEGQRSKTLNCSGERDGVGRIAR